MIIFDFSNYAVLRSNIFVIMGGYKSFASKMLVKIRLW